MPQALTIEELAAATGMTVRNIREHQTRGLLPPPVVHGRRGAYDARHLARLKFIQQLQNEGLNLQAIHWLLERAPDETTEEVVRFERALFAPWGAETPVIWTTDELGRQVGVVQEDLLRRAVELDILRPLDEDRWEVPSPRLMSAGADLLEIGVPLHAALDVVADLRDHTAAVARSFVRLFVTHVWEPFEASGRPADRWAQVRQALERLRPIASEALLAVFHLSMGETIDSATATVLADALDEPA